MNSTYLDQSDYASLQPPATQYPQNMQQFGKDLGQTYASLNFEQNAFDSERFGFNFLVFFKFFFVNVCFMSFERLQFVG